ncbi:lipopolysaccharide biosynthesis protein [Qipengyuania nanhaisediminis]|uniref:Membrane protein involved in the export of O-antigen and teichoic acid n=1 Tax=Qipengyuania nanhaisediminis TaxID=604088 RepID=A0A1I5QBS5_9SPHN|nr:oligosaccharide flippase family protein [Qipengyuania nanhaisediminis]SFP43722.1 Membrane protein involved in the export of O-antigen and teichoic acid [Qipengyuania nanhaisediminis]
MRVMLKNLATLTGASGITALAGLASLALNTRGLGVESFGVLSLILAYTALFAGVATFDVWQPIVRLGVRAPRALGLILSAGIILDIFAAFAATLAALLGSVYLGGWIGIGEDYIWLLQIYAISLLFGIVGTPKGYFRLIDRFDILAQYQVMLSLVMLFSSFILWWVEEKIVLYVMVFATIAVIYKISLMVRMLIELQKNDVRLMSPYSSLRGRRVFKMMLKNSASTSLVSTFATSRRQVALLIVGGLLGGAAAGIFAAAASLASAFAKFSNLVFQVIFKEFVQAAKRFDPKLWHRKIMRLTAVAALVAAFASIVGLPIGSLVLPTVLGNHFIASVPVFSGLFAAECIHLAFLHLNPVIQNKVGPKALIPIAAAGLGIFVLIAIPLAHSWGVIGVALAIVAANAMMALALTVLADQLLRRSILTREV